MAQPPPEPERGQVVDASAGGALAHFPKWSKTLLIFVAAVFFAGWGLVDSCHANVANGRQKMQGDASMHQPDPNMERVNPGPLLAANPYSPPQSPSQAPAQPRQPPEKKKTPEELLAEQLRAKRMQEWYDAVHAGVTSDKHRGLDALTASAEPLPEQRQEPTTEPVTAKRDDAGQPRLTDLSEGEKNRRAQDEYNREHATGKAFQLAPETTLIPCAVDMKIDASFSGPFNCHVTMPVLSRNFQHEIIRAGTAIRGMATKVSDQFQDRVAVTFSRMVMPDGFTVNLNQFVGLDQQGATALSGKVNNHYVQKFGLTMAIGAIAGLAQVGNSGYGQYDPNVGFRIGFTNATSQMALQTLEHYLNRLPTVTIPPGARCDIYLTNDLYLPDYATHKMDPDL